MKRNGTTAVIEYIEEQFKTYIPFMKKYKEESNCFIASWNMETVPPELAASFNILSLKIPSFLQHDETGELFASISDAFIIPSTLCSCSGFLSADIPVYKYIPPAGYGEDAAVAIHNETANFLNSMFNIDLKTIDIEKLQEVTGLYEKLRRTVRGICAARNAAPGLITCEELAVVFEAALIYPPEAACCLIEPLYDILKSVEADNENLGVKAMIFSCDPFPGITADLVEKEGIIITEDDTPDGRRCFDISLDYKSDYIFYELLDAYSYKPYAPCIRSAEERYDLLYKLLRNYGIELIIFLKSSEHSVSYELIDFLRIKSMRNGIDVITAYPEEIQEKGAEYIKNISTPSL